MRAKTAWQRVSVIISTVVMAGFGMTGLASADSISWTGPGSWNVISTSFNMTSRFLNTNNLGFNNANFQSVVTGWAKVEGNTNGGNAMTGNAMNNNASGFWVSATNQATAGSSTGGVMGVSGDNSISDTGPHSVNVITSSQNVQTVVKNTNTVSFNNLNDQSAVSGNAVVEGNTSGGNASTGDATNNNSTGATVAVSNGSTSDASTMSMVPSGSNSISDTGPGSYNAISSWSNSSKTVSNTNNVSVNNLNAQSAKSGNAVVEGNTNGGNASTGDATNNNSSTVDVNAENN